MCFCGSGLYVRNDDEWDWLRSLLTVDKIKYLLDEEYKGGIIERFEIPAIRAGMFTSNISSFSLRPF
jgi:hypothetical protein